MTVKDFVDTILCVPVTRAGNRYIVEAIEIVLDTQEHKFYERLAEIHETTPQILEKAIRDAKCLGLSHMDMIMRNVIFQKIDLPTTEYIVKAALYYRRTYEK